MYFLTLFIYESAGLFIGICIYIESSGLFIGIKLKETEMDLHKLDALYCNVVYNMHYYPDLQMGVILNDSVIPL